MQVPEQSFALSGFPDLRTEELEHADRQAGLQPWIPMDCFQIGKGRRLGNIDSLSLDGMHLVRERQDAAVQKLGVMPKSLCTLSYCTTDPQFRFSDLGADGHDTAFLMSADTEFDIFVPAGVETTYLCLDETAFLATARAIDPDHWETAPRGVQHFTIAQKAALKTLIDSLFTMTSAAGCRQGAVAASAMRQVVQQIILAIATAPDAALSDPPHAPMARVVDICRTARDFIEARLDDDNPPAMAEICLAIGVSERTLQYAFRDYIGLSPLAYFRQMRLNREIG